MSNTQAAVAPKITPKFEVFTNVTPPPVKRGGNLPHGPRGSIYPVDQLAVGGAFFVPAEDTSAEGLDKLTKTVQSSVSRLAKALKFKLSIRKLAQSDDGSVNPWGDAGVGVFRVAGEYVYKPRAKKA